MNEGHEPLRIFQACNTQWVSIATVVERIHKQWLELKIHLNIVRHTESATLLNSCTLYVRMEQTRVT